MDGTIRKICDLLRSNDNMRRCAAAITLAHLTPKDRAVVEALGEAFGDANQTLMHYLLEAFSAIGSPAAVPYVLPLLDSPDAETKLRAAGIISKAGPGVVPLIRDRIAKATPAQKPLLVDLLARIHSREAYATILGLLFDSDFDLVKEACDAVRRHMASATPKERAALYRQTTSFLRTPKVRRSERVLTSCLLLLGSIARPEARTVLLKYTVPRLSPYLRWHALIGLKNIKLTGAAAGSVARAVFSYLKESDEGVVRHSLDVLDRLPLSGSAAAMWPKLLESTHANVRAFAARKLADDDSATGNRRLLALLAHGDNEVREIAAGALAGHKGAARLLLDALARTADGEASMRLAKILKPHSEAVDRRILKRFAALAARDLETGKPRHVALLYFLRNVDAKTADNVLLQTGLKLKRSKKWTPAVDCLRRLSGTELFDDETRYALSVCNLKVSPKVLDPQVRNSDHALIGLQVLARSKSFDLAGRLAKDKTLNATDLYYVGFHFAEITGPERDFGEQVLRHVAKAWPKSKEGKSAKNKLRITTPGRRE